MTKILTLLLLFGVCIQVRCRTHTNANPIVSTSLGKVRGSIITSRLGRKIYAFRGMRYAKPPINDLRFQAPVPVDRWEGIYDATENGPLCPQPRQLSNISEDCLVVNVYSTKLPSRLYNPKRPVIIYVHPGGFVILGSATDWAGPDYIMDKDAVLVTFNYRLAALGFLSTGDKEAPGNNGYKDQVLAFKWVQKNIEAFGGDRNSVTLLGYSAGGWSNILHMVSPMSRGLFHRVLAMSGSPLGTWPIEYDQLDLAKKQAGIVGCPNDTSANIIRCLKTVPYEKLGESLPQFAEFSSVPLMIWSPVIEKDFGQERFLHDHPIRLVTKGEFQKVPLIVGRTELEYAAQAFGVVQNETYTKEMNEDFERVAPITFLYERNTEQSKKVSRAVKKFYLHDRPVDKSQLNDLAKAYTDSIVGFQAHRAVKLMAEYNTECTWYYCFTFKGRYSNFYLPGTNNTVPWGAVHFDDMMYLFFIQAQFPRFEANSPRPEIDMVEKLTTLYTDFAKTGKPTSKKNPKLDNVSWDPYNLRTRKYLEIGNKLIMKEKLDEERLNFWENLFPLSMYTEKNY